MKKILPTLLLAAITLLMGCASVQKKEQLLTAAGFRAVTADTPAQAAHLKSLQVQTKGHITPITKNGRTFFIFTDDKKNLLFIGAQSQYTAYKQLRLQKQLSRDEAATTDLNDHI